MEVFNQKLKDSGKEFIILYRFVCPQCDKTIYSEEEKTYWWCPRCNLFLAEETLEGEIKIYKKI